MILIFAGAGASKAVNAEHYPTTVEFFESLPDDLRQPPLFGHVIEFLRAREPEAVLDIERMLWTLDELREFVTVARTTDGFPGWLLTKQRLNTIAPPRQPYDPRPTLEILQSVGRETEALISAVNQRVYTLYRREPRLEELESTWLPLLRKALSLTPRVDVFTTNYDLVLEQAIEIGGLSIDTGRTRGVTPRLQVDSWVAARTEISGRRTGLLTKLHGSIDWIRGDQGEIYVGTPQFTGQHQQHAIIYPGFKGTPADLPFTHFHDYLGAACDLAKAVIFVGFAFRDEHINAVARERIRPGVPILLIGGSNRQPQVPFRTGQYKYIGGGFNSSAVGEAVRWLDTGLMNISA